MVKIKKTRCKHVEGRERDVYCTVILERYQLPKGVKFLEDIKVKGKLKNAVHAEICLHCARMLG